MAIGGSRGILSACVELPTGTVTFLFTDVEGSTRLLHELGDAYADVLAEHRRVLRAAFGRHGGVEVDTQGDAFFVPFAKAADALKAASDARDALAGGTLRVRMGLHTGKPLVTGEGYVGIDVHRAARIAAAGHGGQILVSQSTRDLAGAHELRYLGEHRLKDLTAPERIYQLGDGEFPPLKSLNNSNLPMPAEPLIGRKKELADVLRSMREGARVLTVTGPGGIGKTRFALEVARELVDDFHDGVWWVGLAPIRDPRLVLPTMAASLGEKGDLEGELRGKRLLFLLDNFEQVVAAARDLAQIHRMWPHVALLVTSREPLHVAGEREYPLSPLPEAPAVELLRQRAEAVSPDFQADYRDLVQVCDRLDGLPLAIELAAARTKSMTVRALLERLDQRLPLLTSRRRDVDERQRTLLATIEWSYDLLEDHEKELLAALAVFAGSFESDAAVQVCDADLDALESFVDKSLLRRTEQGRFFMLETIREYALGRLRERADSLDLHERHAVYWLNRAEAAASDPRPNDALPRLDADIDDLRAALSWAVEHDRGRAFRVAAGLVDFWQYTGRQREGDEWVRSAWSEDAPAATRLGALRTLAASAGNFGHTAALRELSERRLRLAESVGDEFHAVGALNGLAIAAHYELDIPRAKQLYESALERAVKADVDAAAIRANLGLIARLEGDYERARRLLTDDLERARKADRPDDEIWALQQLGETALDEGALEEAAARLGEGLRRALAVGQSGGLGGLLLATAILAFERGAPEDGAVLAGAAEAAITARGTGDLSWTPMGRRVAADSSERARELRETGRRLAPDEAVQLAFRYLD